MESIIAQINSRFKLGNLGSNVFRFRLFLQKFFILLTFSGFGILSFFLGQSSKFLENKPTFSFESKEAEEENFVQVKEKLFEKKVKQGGTIVASRTGKKYYFVWCKGAGNLKEKNKIYFASEVLAQNAGYILANACK